MLSITQDKILLQFDNSKKKLIIRHSIRHFEKRFNLIQIFLVTNEIIFRSL